MAAASYYYYVLRKIECMWQGIWLFHAAHLLCLWHDIIIDYKKNSKIDLE